MFPVVFIMPIVTLERCPVQSKSRSECVSITLGESQMTLSHYLDLVMQLEDVHARKQKSKKKEEKVRYSGNRAKSHKREQGRWSALTSLLKRGKERLYVWNA